MLGVILLSLLVMTIVFGGVGFLMFWDVAFRSPEPAVAYQPAATPVTVTTKRSSAGVNGVELAYRVEQAVSRLVQRLGPWPATAERCEAACGNREIHITTPEALAIVHELRQRHPGEQVAAIQNQARRNLDARQVSRGCPLRLPNGSCACAAARPVSCRTHCLIGPDLDLEGGLMADSVGKGATEIFRDCLRASGLDDSEYELNQALVQALSTPNAARRWAQGERILEVTPSCRV